MVSLKAILKTKEIKRWLQLGLMQVLVEYSMERH